MVILSKSTPNARLAFVGFRASTRPTEEWSKNNYNHIISILYTPNKPMRKLSLFAFLLLLLNSAYLFSFGEPTLFYISNILIHIVLGTILLIPFCFYLYKQIKTLSYIGKVGVIGLIMGIISGGYLMIVGATTPYRWLLITHIISISSGSILFSIHLLKYSDTLSHFLKIR